MVPPPGFAIVPADPYGAKTRDGEVAETRLPPSNPTLEILDIRRDQIEHSLKAEIFRQLQPVDGQEKQLPTLLLYDEVGLRLFEEITYLDEYYLTNAELEILREHAGDMAHRIRPGSVVMELGSGNLRKVKLLLDALEHLGRDVEYYALDLSLPELSRTLSQIPSGAYKHVKCSGLHGTYQDGLAWIKSPKRQSSPKCVLFLGSSLGNFPRHEAAAFLRQYAEVLQPEDAILLGLDACKDKDKVYPAYNDQLGVTHEFIRNGLSHANKILGKEAFDKDEWRVVGRYNETAGRHEAYYSPVKDLSFESIDFTAGEMVRVEQSNKFSAEDRSRLWSSAELAEGAAWGDRTGEYHLHMLYRPRFSFSLDPAEYAARAVPSLDDWTQLWKAWDTVTRHMLPQDELLSRPISLRNPCIFYLGHVPTFLDMHLARATEEPLVVPASYPRHFERGIDPDMEDPERCNPHSEIPDVWPAAAELGAVQDAVRGRVARLYQTRSPERSRKLSRALWLAFEHEAMHLETTLYLLLQSESTLPPPGSIRPDFEALALEAQKEAVENQWFTIPTATIEIGLQDHDDESAGHHHFGWDNESPAREVTARSFQAKARPISVGEYAHYLEETGNGGVPASWALEPAREVSHDTRDGTHNGAPPREGGASSHFASEVYSRGKSVKTIFGPVPLAQALHWPVSASYDELQACASWMGGRLPTYDEVRSIYHYVDEQKAPKVLSGTIAAVNGHLLNDGVEETPPSGSCRRPASHTEPGPDLQKLFTDLQGCNTGFAHWHPVPVTQHGGRLCGQGDMGGVWEWTSTVLEQHEGFKSMELYPGYTADFFDSKHNIMQGGSWATHPRIAGRRTFVNWYQRAYPFAWAGGRLVRDV